jgi:hypothetical protein
LRPWLGDDQQRIDEFESLGHQAPNQRVGLATGRMTSRPVCVDDPVIRLDGHHHDGGGQIRNLPEQAL